MAFLHKQFVKDSKTNAYLTIFDAMPEHERQSCCNGKIPLADEVDTLNTKQRMSVGYKLVHT